MSGVFVNRLCLPTLINLARTKPVSSLSKPSDRPAAWEGREGGRGQPEARDVADFFGGEFRLLCHTFREAMDPFEWRS